MSGRQQFSPDLEHEIAQALQGYACFASAEAAQRLQGVIHRLTRFATQHCMPLEKIVAELRLVHADIPKGDHRMDGQMKNAFDRLVSATVVSFYDASEE